MRARVTLKGRLWISLSLVIVLVLLQAGHNYVGGHAYTRTWIEWLRWIELSVAAVAVFWCGWPQIAGFLARRRDGAALLAIAGVTVYSYGLLAMLTPEIWPPAWRDVHGMVPMRMELAAGVIVLALLVELFSSRPQRR